MFLNHKKLRRKIPNIFIINQVSVVEVDTFAHWELQKYLNNTVLLIMIKIDVQQSWNITKEIFPVHFVEVISTFCGTSFTTALGFRDMVILAVAWFVTLNSCTAVIACLVSHTLK